MDNIYPSVKSIIENIKHEENLSIYDEQSLIKFSEDLFSKNTIFKLMKNIKTEDIIDVLSEYCINKKSVNFYNNIIQYFKSNLVSNACFNIFETSLKNLNEFIQSPEDEGLVEYNE